MAPVWRATVMPGMLLTVTVAVAVWQPRSVLHGSLQLTAAALKCGFDGIKVPPEIRALDANASGYEVNTWAKNIGGTQTAESISCHTKVVSHLCGGAGECHGVQVR